jgi:hypothetical protein
MSKIPRTSVQLQQMIIDEMGGPEKWPPNLNMWVEPYQRYWRVRTSIKTSEDDGFVGRIEAIVDRLRRKYDLVD